MRIKLNCIELLNVAVKFDQKKKKNRIPFCNFHVVQLVIFYRICKNYKRILLSTRLQLKFVHAGETRTPLQGVPTTKMLDACTNSPTMSSDTGPLGYHYGAPLGSFLHIDGARKRRKQLAAPIQQRCRPLLASSLRFVVSSFRPYYTSRRDMSVLLQRPTATEPALVQGAVRIVLAQTVFYARNERGSRIIFSAVVTCF